MRTVVFDGDLEQLQLDGELDIQLRLDGTAGLIDTLDGECELRVQLDGDAELNNVLDGECGIITQVIGGDVYTGDYIVTPKAHSETILATSGKAMANNVTVLKIPYYETSNLSGNTVYIANEV